MRTRRIKADPEAASGFYHCISRVVDRRRIFGRAEKEHFVRLLGQLSVFCDVKVLAYCVMDNHFHLLLEVPRRPETLPSDRELLRRLGAVHSKVAVSGVRRVLKLLPESEGAAYRESFWRRMWDVSVFLKELKQRFSQWYNHRQSRAGTLWEDRFKSVLIEPGSLLIAVIAAYIDLNPVRARMVSDPMTYPWSSYGAAMAGVPSALAGYQRIQELVEARSLGRTEAFGSYRIWLHRRAGARGLMDEDRVRAIIARDGRIDLEDAVMVRVQRFSCGLALGTRDFIEGMIVSHGHLLGGKRPRIASPVPGLKGGIFTLRRSIGDSIG